jgi:exosome complex component RRP4
MTKENVDMSREVVLPGDLLDSGRMKPGSGAYAHEGKVYAAQLGIKVVKSNFINVMPLGGRYIPEQGDLVIGKVEDIGPSNWLIDIKSPYPAPLHVTEVPWKVEFGDTSRYLNVGDTIMAKILMVDETKRVQVTMKEQGLRKMQGGQVVEISHTKVPRVIGKGGSMISMIKMVAIRAIRMIEEGAQTHHLTEKVKDFLDSVAKDIKSDGNRE